MTPETLRMWAYIVPPGAGLVLGFIYGWIWGQAVLRKRLEEAEDLVREVARSGVEFEDPRVRHVTVQIDVDTWRGCVAALAGEEKP